MKYFYWKELTNRNPWYRLFSHSLAYRDFLDWWYHFKLRLVARFITTHKLGWSEADADRWAMLQDDAGCL